MCVRPLLKVCVFIVLQVVKLKNDLCRQMLRESDHNKKRDGQEIKEEKRSMG